MNGYCSCDQVFERLTRGPFPAQRRFPNADDEREGRELGSCDRGRDPLDHEEMAIEAHLAVCHECRQLAEAMRPAVSLCEDVVRGPLAPLPVIDWSRQPRYEPRERSAAARIEHPTSEPACDVASPSDLPVYRGTLPYPGSRHAEARLGNATTSVASANVSTGPEAVSRQSPAGMPWPMVAATVAGLVLGAWLTQWRETAVSRSPSGWLGWSQRAPVATEDRWMVASLRLSHACLSSSHQADATVRFPQGPGQVAGEAPVRLGRHPGAPIDERVVCCTRCHASQAGQQPPMPTVPTVEVSRLLVACLACHES